jgi:hypothetical protein
VKRGLIVLLAGLALATGAGAATLTHASLRLKTLHPLTVHGSRFAPGEHVRLTLKSAGKRQARRVTASSAGVFSVTFDAIPVDRCSAFVVTALGSRGGTATLRHPPLPQCAPARSP